MLPFYASFFGEEIIMIEAGWDEERIQHTPLTLYMEYINLKHQNFIKERIKDLDITPGGFTYLINIYYHENLSQRQLADILYVSEANVAKIVKKLEKNGYIERIPDEVNKSRKILKLTDKGLETTCSLVKMTWEWEVKITKYFSEVQVNKLKEVLYDLIQESAEY